MTNRCANISKHIFLKEAPGGLSIYKDTNNLSLLRINISSTTTCFNPDSKVHGANMGPTWVLLAPDGPHVGPMNLAIMEYISMQEHATAAIW